MSTKLRRTPPLSGWPLRKRSDLTLVEVSQYTCCCVFIKSSLYLFSQCNPDIKCLCICCMLNKPLSESECEPIIGINHDCVCDIGVKLPRVLSHRQGEATLWTPPAVWHQRYAHNHDWPLNLCIGTLLIEVHCFIIILIYVAWVVDADRGESQVGELLKPLRPRQNGRHFADDVFKCIFLNENVWISLKISLKFVPKGLINNIPSLVQIMAWRRPGDKPLSEPMMVILLTHIFVTRPQWVKPLLIIISMRRDSSEVTTSKVPVSISPVY